MLSPSLRVKYVFLSFLQEFFKNHPKYTWDKNPRDTKIIIADKFAIDIGIAAMKPSIIIDRGGIGWTGNFRNEAEAVDKRPYKTGESDRAKFIPKLSDFSKDNYKLTDLLSASATLNIVSKDPFEADYIANEVFYQISAYREHFKDRGIHKFNGLSLGKENVVDLNAAKIKVTQVPINLSFMRQESIILGKRYFNAQLYSSNEPLYENRDYTINLDGTEILLFGEFPDLSLDYIDAITLEPVENVILVPLESSPNRLLIPDNGKIYGYYKIFMELDLEKIN